MWQARYDGRKLSQLHVEFSKLQRQLCSPGNGRVSSTASTTCRCLCLIHRTTKPCLTQRQISTSRSGAMLKKSEHTATCLGAILSGMHNARHT